MYKIISILVLLNCLSINLIGQSTNSYTLSGAIVVGTTNLPLVGANIISSNGFGTKSNSVGEFELSTSHNDTIKISYIGFKTIRYISPKKESGKYLIKFRMYADSISLAEVEIFPWPTYKEFKKSFLAMNKEDEKIKMKSVKMYIDKSRSIQTPSILSPASFIYDRLFDKKAKVRRRLARRRKTIKNSKYKNE